MGGNPESTARQGYRFRMGIPAEIRRGEATVACDAQNVSRSGVLLVGVFTAISGEAVDFSLKSPTGNLSVQLSGRVTRVTPGAQDGGVTVGIELVNMDDSRRDALDVLLARMLQTPSTMNSLETLKPGSPPLEIKRVLEAIPLPQRIALATRAATKEREYLRLDTHPAVLEQLVRNPSFTVAEARVLATSAYLMPGTLDALAQDLRFKDDEEVRFAVACHPRVTPSTAERVTATLKPPQIKKLLSRPGLNQILREKLFRRTTQR